nr:11571_t:CDS:10 [Entrophospora candida]
MTPIEKTSGPKISADATATSSLRGNSNSQASTNASIFKSENKSTRSPDNSTDFIPEQPISGKKRALPPESSKFGFLPLDTFIKEEKPRKPRTKKTKSLKSESSLSLYPFITSQTSSQQHSTLMPTSSLLLQHNKKQLQQIPSSSLSRLTLETSQLLSASYLPLSLKHQEGLLLENSHRTKRVRKQFHVESMSAEPSILTEDGFWIPTDKKKTSATELKVYYDTCVKKLPDATRSELLKLGTLILDRLLAQGFSKPFVNPESESAIIYREYIHRLMDLNTLESNLWSGKYRNPTEMLRDLFQIMFNAFIFHEQNGEIYKDANLMKDFIKEMLDPFSKLYLMPIFEFRHKNKKYSCMKTEAIDRLTTFNKPILELFDNEVLPPTLFDETAVTCNFDRLYIANIHSQLLRSIQNDNATLLLLKNIKWTPETNHFKCQIIRAKPFGRFHKLDQLAFNELRDGRYWVRIAYLNKVELEFVATKRFYDFCIRYPFEVREYKKDWLPLDFHKNFIRLLANSIVTTATTNATTDETINTSTILLNYQSGFVNKNRMLIDPQLLDIDNDANYMLPYHQITNNNNENDVGIEMMTDPQLPTENQVSTDPELIINDLEISNSNDDEDDAFVALIDNSQYLDIWNRLVQEAAVRNIPVIDIISLDKEKVMKAEGCFKSVYHLKNNQNSVLQYFKRINDETLEARFKEVAFCLKIIGASNTGQIKAIYKNKNNQLVGISMEKYKCTLKEHLFDSKKKFTGGQKFKIIRDFVNGMKEIHDAGFAHRDLSEVNLMLDENDNLVVIDFGKAEFIGREDAQKWTIKTIPEERLNILPKIFTTPDHGYKLYRSAVTLPHRNNDKTELRNPIDPLKEDIYSVGVLIWRIFSGQAPWGGILDTDLKELRKIVGDEKLIRFYIERQVMGQKSKDLLYMAIRSSPKDRHNINELLTFLDRNKDKLIQEWDGTSRRIKRSKWYDD